MNPTLRFGRDALLMDQLKSAIQDAEVVSFDVFDTLISRPVSQPVLMFDYMERVWNAPGFAGRRRHAEQAAYSKVDAGSDPSLETIYGCDLLNAFVIERELMFELEVCFPRPEGMELFEWALHLGKTVVVISDTYYSSEFLRKLLESKGYSGVSRVYASSELGGSKRKGNLFEAVISDLKEAKGIIHIGDNYKSDVLNSTKSGFRGLHIPKAKASFTDWRMRLLSTIVKQSGERFVMLDVFLHSGITRPENKLSEWERFAHQFVVPSYLAFASWLLRSPNSLLDCQTIVMAGRDCFSLAQMQEFSSLPIPCFYQEIGRSVIRKVDSDPGLRQALMEQLVTRLAVPARDIVGFVDVGTQNFSAQRFLSRLGFQVRGFYFTSSAEGMSSRAFMTRHEGLLQRLFLRSQVLEFFFSAPLGSVLDLDPSIESDCGLIEAIYDDPKEIEHYKHQAVRVIERVLKSIKFPSRLAPFTSSEIALLNAAWIVLPTTSEKQMLRRIFGSSDPTHTIFRRQLKFGKTNLLAFMIMEALAKAASPLIRKSGNHG